MERRHFSEPQNVGIIADPDGTGTLETLDCGDAFVMFIRVRDDVLADVKFVARTCAFSLASCSAVTELAKGKTLSSAMAISEDDIIESLGGLPPEKRHCAKLAITLLHRAIEDYRNRHKPDLRDWRSLYDKCG